ncbi:MAG: hypothetical protein ACREVZ_11125 [Burkholderiales bacterium]
MARLWHRRPPQPPPAQDVTDRLGISICPDDGRDPSLLIRLADKAIYDAWQTGRTRYRL